MGSIFTDEEKDRMIKFTAKNLYEYMKEEPCFDIDNLLEADVRSAVKEWLSEMDDSDLQVQFVKACAREIKKAIDQAVKEDT